MERREESSATEIKLFEGNNKDALASKDEIIKFLKRNEEGLTDRISNYKELEVVQGKL